MSDAISRRLHALLIGIDCYLPNRLPDGGSYPHLGGCVRDVHHIEAFLKDRLGLANDRILKLTATNPDLINPLMPITPIEAPERWPTYDNMVAAFQELTRRGESGDEVYIHYSGHGGRTATIIPGIKGQNALDESLVPTDIGAVGTRYLRDVELAYLIKQMTDKGLVVTIVLDSCHSGGATRGKGGGAVRGISSIDTREAPKDSKVAPLAELAQNWLEIPTAQSKSASLSSGWLATQRDTILLAACRANELANEFAFDGNERNGALTYWLLDSFKQISPSLTFSRIHDRILAKVHTTFPQQSPQLQGDGSRVVFNTIRVPRLPAVRVLTVDVASQRVRLETGKAQGTANGARFAIYPPQATDLTDTSNQLAVVEIVEAQDAESWGKIDPPGNAQAIEPGAQATLLDAGSIVLRSAVRLIHSGDPAPGINEPEALARVEAEIRKNSWVKLATDAEEADRQIAINANGDYEVWDPSGLRIKNLRPPIRGAEIESATQVVQRLVHLTKYRNVKLIENSAATNSLARQIIIEIVGAETASAPGGVPVMYAGETGTLRLRNKSSKDLNVTILDLQPDWGITQIYPPDKDYEILSPGTSLDLPLTFDLPDYYKEGVDTIKVFVTVNPTSFRWLELPVLDQPLAPTRAVSKGTANPLEALMQAFGASEPLRNARKINLGAASPAMWTSAQVDVLVRRPFEAPRHVRDPRISLLQAAFDEIEAEKSVEVRSKGGESLILPISRPSAKNPLLEALTEAFLNPPAIEPPLPMGPEKGVKDTAKYCANMAAGMAKELWNKIHGDGDEYEAYKAALTAKFGDCDPRFAKALAKYAEYLAKGRTVPYRRWQQLADFVIEGELKPDAVIGIVADWGTGRPEAIEVLQQVKQHSPQVAIHLGDIYYAGTAFEVENYFYQPWQQVLRPEASGVRSFALPGNHDFYAGGKPYYDLIDKFDQPASYFCYRNSDWQLIGIDTALNDKLGGPPTALEPAEVEWLRDKIENPGTHRTILLSHHQLFSTNENWNGKSFNENLHNQVAVLLPKIDIWFWGHEHDLIIFESHLGLTRGRCIGGSAFPVGKYEMPELVKNSDVPFNKGIMLSKGSAFYQHCYAVLRLAGRNGEVCYFEDSGHGRLLFSEII